MTPSPTPPAQFRYLKKGHYMAIVSEDLRPLAAAELRELGVTELEEDLRHIDFAASPELVMKIVYCARLITRVLAPLHRFDAPHPDVLYTRVKEMEWEHLLDGRSSLAVMANIVNSRALPHSQFAALRVKDAICDRLRAITGLRPDVDRDEPDALINLHVNGFKATLAIDLGGGSLHKRGYRLNGLDAPLAETLAAAFLRTTQWDGRRPLVDPMCGSGTILAEALMLATRTPAQFLRRHFGFGRLPGFEPAAFEKVKKECDALIIPLPPGLIRGSDADPQALAATLKNLSCLPSGEEVLLRQSLFQDLPALPEGSLILTNPPYGLRIGHDADMELFMREFGTFMKKKCPGSTVWAYFGNRELLRFVGLQASARRPFENGGLDGRLARFEMYSGTRRTSFKEDRPGKASTAQPDASPSSSQDAAGQD